MRDTMSTSSQSLSVQEKKEVTAKSEKTIPARFFTPATDIFETDEALTVVMEMPGVEKEDLDVHLENDVVRVEGRISFDKYAGLDPLYTSTMSATSRARSRSRAPSTRNGSRRSWRTAC
jgi:HSP20 family molecular chaperone IbpA